MEEKELPSGLLLVDKPHGWSSFDVVNKVRWIISKEWNIKSKQIKVGHSGTLDPAATGLLVLGVGKATKEMKGLIKKDKTYEVGATLGVTSSTGDSEGDKTINKSAKPVDSSALEAVLLSYLGENEQIPHKYSAIKVGGIRAYKLARSSKQVDLKPRKVQIYSINLVNYRWPLLNFDVRVSSGTYIRSLVEDIGKNLGSGAYTSSLRRTVVGEFNVVDAIDTDTLSYENILNNLLPLAQEGEYC